MTRAAPRIDTRLLAAIERLDKQDRSFAETNRRVGVVAETLGLPRPSYEQVRRLIGELRARRVNVGAGEILLDIAFRTAPPQALAALADRDSYPRRSK